MEFCSPLRGEGYPALGTDVERREGISRFAGMLVCKTFVIRPVVGLRPVCVDAPCRGGSGDGMADWLFKGGSFSPLRGDAGTRIFRIRLITGIFFLL